jgi:NAD-dependent histone deacetylase SIR2
LTNPTKPIHHINFDINLLGDCDVIVAELARRAGWSLSHSMIPEGHENVVETVNEMDHVYSVKAKGPASQPIRNEVRHDAFDSVVKSAQA